MSGGTVDLESNLAPLLPLLRRLDHAAAAADTRAICADVKAALMEELGQGRVPMPEPFLQPVPTGYARRRLFLDPKGRFSVVVMVWGPGQGTPLHDHAGHWCVECVYDGRIRVTSYDREREDQGRILFRQRGTVLSDIGAAGALIPPFEYHTIENPFDTKAVTLHVYEGELTWCNAFEPLEPAGWFRPQRHELGYSA
ncbi:MAG TPA: cysteine dioxygenase family protein [Candidatus Krumholzibacteria bacterium]|nr:cysteine dioxygenase family protein [Candidatus Krumholzibacteria bacterium]